MFRAQDAGFQRVIVLSRKRFPDRYESFRNLKQRSCAARKGIPVLANSIRVNEPRPLHPCFPFSLHRASATPIAISATIGTTSSQKHFCVKSDRSNTPTTLNISEQVSWLSQKPRFIGQATSVINMSRMARHFLRVLTVIRSKKNKIQTEFQ